MENRPIENSEFRVRLESILDALATLFNINENSFQKVFKKLPQVISSELVRLRYTEEYDNTELEDIVDYCREVLYYSIDSDKDVLNFDKEKSVIKKTFTLRNPDDLNMFGTFLDKMLLLADISPGHFLKILIKCPQAYWDKIEDLRETSFKRERDSEEYLECLRKSKEISFSYDRIHALNYENNDNYE